MKNKIISMVLLLFFFAVSLSFSSININAQVNNIDLFFYENLTESEIISRDTQAKLINSAENLYQDNDVHFYTVVIDSSNDIAGYIYDIMNDLNQDIIKNVPVNFFVYQPDTGDYSLYLSDMILNSDGINLYTINKNIGEFENNILQNNTDMAFENVSRLINYLTLVANAATGANQLNINSENIDKHYNIYPLDQTEFILNENNENNEYDEYDEYDEYENESESSRGSSMSIILLVIILILLLLIMLIIIRRVRSSRYEDDEEYAIEEIEDDDIY